MSTLLLRTPRLDLRLESTAELVARIEALSPDDRAQVSPAWLERLRTTPHADPWTHGFAIHERAGGAAVGSCGFKGPPDAEGVVEIAYQVDEPERGRGYATEAARALVEFAATQQGARRVRAHTLPEASASTRVLERCGFVRIGEVIDPEDGPVWRWEKAIG